MGKENAGRCVYLGVILLRPQHFSGLVRAQYGKGKRWKGCAQYGKGKRWKGCVFGTDSSAAAALFGLSSGSVWERKTLAGVCIWD